MRAKKLVKEKSELGYSCPKCKGQMCVIDSRRTRIIGEQSIRRRRKCINAKCKKRLTTYEIHQVVISQVEAGRKILDSLTAAIRIVSREKGGRQP